MTKGETGGNLLPNGNFEKNRNGLPEKWMAPGYGKAGGSIKIYMEDDTTSAGNHFVSIEISKKSAGRLLRFLRVKPDRVYKFSCRIKAQGVGQEGKGAYISVLNTPGASRDFKDTGGTWRYTEFYGRTGAEQQEIAVAVRLANPKAPNTGKASFDDFRIEEVTDIVAQGIEIVNLSREMPETPRSKKPARKTRPVIGITFLLAGFMILFLGIYYLQMKPGKTPSLPGPRQEKETAIVYFIFLAAAFLLRIFLAPAVEGYPTDIACFKGWAGMAAEKGLPDFYLSDAFVDYPPGYIYILYLLGLLRKLFSLSFDSTAFLILIKSPAIIADLITSLVIFRLGKKKLGFASASFLSLIYAFNPVIIFDSTVYGQVDSIPTLLILLVLIFLYEDRLQLASVVFVIAVLVKPQALIFSPVILFAFIRPGIGQKERIKTFFVSACLAAVTFILIILPFSLKQDPFWIIHLYKKTLASYPFASLNAFNLFALFGGNLVQETETFFIFSYKTWGFIFIAVIVAFSALLYFKSRDKSRVFFIALFIMAAVFVLSAKMHERYLFPAIVLALLCYVVTRDKRMLILFWGFSATLLINVAMVLHLILNRTFIAVPRGDFLLRLISFANLYLLAYTVKIAVDRYIKNKNKNKIEGVKAS
ncbi:glycosyltransferase 87 family protein [Acidobacteriota bacterium]